MLIDSHAHLDDYTDLPGVLARAHAAGVSAILAIGIGDGPDTMQQALEIAREHKGEPKLYASAGIHPQEAANATSSALDKLSLLVSDPHCIAVGEIGLDYYHAGNPDIPTQMAAFVAQMHIARSAGKPILIHCRTSELARPEAKQKFGPADAWHDLLTLIDEHWSHPGAAGIMHCFSGTPRQAHLSVDRGFYISFAGNLTYPKSAGIQEAARTLPADRILVETDAPFLAPIPHRGERNEPGLVQHTAATLAALRGVSPEEIAAITTANFRRLFGKT